MVLPTRFELVCPEECKCEREGLVVYCSDSQLNNIPSNFPTHVRQLQLNSNNINCIEKCNFDSRGLVELEMFRADFCKLKKIELGAFNGLTNMMLLSMMGNEISDIIMGTFEKMSRLKMLVLDNNIIEFLESDVFNGLVDIKFISLHGNKLQDLHPDTFLGLSNLQSLQIPNESSVIISIILKKLAISGCNASSVSVQAFTNISALKLLDLSCNNLTSVDINILKVLPNQSAIYLYGNSLNCNCQLQEVWRWCQDHNIQTAYQETAPECDTPSEVEGMWWGVLEKRQCL
jgi:Leucine-rich repeat (LRR) protein